MHKLKKYSNPLIGFFISLFILQKSVAQVSISGPSCVAPGIEYQYTISGNWNFSTFMDWCVTGGTITGGGTCMSGTPLPQIYVTFTAGTGRQITLNTSAGNATLNITMAATLQPGSITPASQTIFAGQTAAAINSTAATGGSCTPTYSYQWQESSDNVFFSDISGATGPNLSFSSGPSLTTYYRCKVTVSPDGTIGYSNSHTVFVSTPLNGGVISTGNQTIDYPTIPAALIASAAWGGGCSTFSYQWEESSDNSAFTPISGATSENYTFAAAPLRSKYYHRKVTCAGPQLGYSNTVYVIVNFKQGSLAASQSIAPGGAVAALNVTGTSGGFGTVYTYQWEKSTDEINWTVVSGASTSSYTPPSPATTTYYRVLVGSAAEALYTNTVSIRVTITAAVNTPNGSVATATLTPVAMPAYPSGTDPLNMNYVRTRAFVKPGIADLATANAQTDKMDVAQATAYFDGLGREWQTVAKSATPAGKDIISTNYYDEYGRVKQQWLPYTDNIESGSFRSDPATQQPAFYNSYFSNTESFYYSSAVFENSPLNRAFMQIAPGKTWGGNNKGTRAIPRANRLTEDVRMFTIGTAIGSVPQYIAAYNAGELMVTETTDEQDNKVIEYKERNGLIVLKKVQVTNLLQEAHGGWFCTYYMYDDFKRLRYVAPPKAVEWMAANGWNLTANTTVQNELCFRYEYDGEGRMIIKKVPGAGEVWMVYDGRDRLVMTQDAKLRTQTTQQWMVMEYDNTLNRPWRTGLWNNSSDRTTHETAAAQSINYPAPSSGYEILTETFFDTYTYAGVKAYDASFNSNLSSGVNPYPLANVKSDITTGVATGTRIKVLGTASQYLITSIYYDHWGRAIQSLSDNQSTGVDIVTSQYDFSGKILSSYIRHEKSGAPVTTVTLLTKMEYDHGGRIKNITKSINDGAEKTLAQNSYDELGRFITKTLSPTGGAGGGPLETLDYKYTIRGWLQGINRGYANPTTYTSEAGLQSGRWFGMELLYDYGFVKNQYNGNIGGTRWRSKGDGEQRAFGYDYDNVNRLLKADFSQYTGGAFNQNAGFNYNVKMGDGIDVTTAYDENGNIKRMQQFGYKIGNSASTPLDDLAYTYTANTNKLAKVADAIVTADNGKLGDFKDGANGAADDYGYDKNGNLITDLNKAMTGPVGLDITSGGAITYNHLNLPQQIIVTGKGNITYTYDAAGGKQKKVTTETNATVNYNGTNYTAVTITTTTAYISGAVYETKTYSNAALAPLQYTDRLQFIGHEEGRIRYKHTTATFEYDYMLKDHLGNVRMVLTEEVKQDYYPAATLENVTFNGGTAVSVEDDYYTVTAANVVTQATATGIPVYQNNNGIFNNNPYSNTTANSARLYRLNASTNTVPNKTGLGIILKVMAGDNLNIFGKSYHKKPTAGYTLSTNPLTVSNIIGLFTGTALITGKATSGQITGQSGFPTTVTSLLNNQPLQNVNRPRASINWIILDEQFRYVSGGFDMVETAVNTTGTFKTHTVAGIPIPKNGYIYIYCSNESRYPVFFDNVQVVHNRSALLEETHYYPFGLTMAGISSKAAGGVDNKFKYNGKELQSAEFSDGSGLEEYDYGARHYNAQIGRWMRPDAMSDFYEGASPYSYALNDPINAIDPDGNLIIFVGGLMPGQWFNQGIGADITYPGRRAFTYGAPTYNGNKFSYGWGNEWIPGKSSNRRLTANSGVGGVLTSAYNDHNYMFISASNGPTSGSKKRFNEGVEYGNQLIQMLEEGNIALAEGETIKIVGHSQGGAFAAGIASVLAKHQKYSSRLEVVHYIAPHQPQGFSHPSNIPAHQWSTRKDDISSRNNFFSWGKGKSIYAKINGVSNGNFHERDDYEGGYHGHMVNTWMYDIAIWAVRNNIPVTVNGVPYGPTPPPPVTPPSPPPPVTPPPVKPPKAF